jgi:hypothetical protein
MEEVMDHPSWGIIDTEPGISGYLTATGGSDKSLSIALLQVKQNPSLVPSW